MCDGVCYNLIRFDGGSVPVQNLNLSPSAVTGGRRGLADPKRQEQCPDRDYSFQAGLIQSQAPNEIPETWPVKSWLPREPLGLKPETRPTETWSKSGWQDADLNHGAFGSYRRTEQSRRVSRYGCILT